MVQTIATSPSGSQQPYFPASSARLLPSTPPTPLLDERGRAVVPSHIRVVLNGVERDNDKLYRRSQYVWFEEWWAAIQPSAMHDPPYTAFYPPLAPNQRQPTRGSSSYHLLFEAPASAVSECYPDEWLSADAAKLHYPSPAHYAHVIAAYNAAVEDAYRALQPARPRAEKVAGVVAGLSILGLPVFMGLVHSRRRRALRAMHYALILVLRQANDELDREWSCRRRTQAAADESSGRRWQWRWVGTQPDYAVSLCMENPRLALVHIAPSL